MATTSEYGALKKLRTGGHKLTPQRRAVVRALCLSNKHMTPAEVHAAACRERADVGLVTVYRTIRMLADLDLVCEISVDGHQRTYLLRGPSEHHHHLVCSHCGRVVDFTSNDVERLQARLALETGFSIEDQIVEFIGRCALCQRQGQETQAVH